MPAFSVYDEEDEVKLRSECNEVLLDRNITGPPIKEKFLEDPYYFGLAGIS